MKIITSRDERILFWWNNSWGRRSYVTVSLVTQRYWLITRPHGRIMLKNPRKEVRNLYRLGYLQNYRMMIGGFK